MDSSTAKSFISKRIAQFVINSSVGTKVVGLGALFHSGDLGGWVDPDYIDGYRYNYQDGKWYDTPPAPDYGQWDWNGKADPSKSSDLDARRNDRIQGNEIENRKPWRDVEPDSIPGIIKIVDIWGRMIWEKIRQTISPSTGNTPDPLVKTIKYVPYVDPLILDLDGDGLEITRLNGIDSVKFDTDGDGVRTATAWAGADDGFVVFDRNGNGTIDNGSELFGDETVLANGQKATDGFAALADLDSNHDGYFNSQDAQYSSVRIWRDLNQDGISQANELKSLHDSGVAGITLASVASTAQYPDAQLVRNGSFSRTGMNTGSGQAGSFLLGQNNFYTEFSTVPLSTEARALPDLAGSGKVRDLREAASLSPELVGLVHAAENASTRAGYKDAVAALMRAWGNDSGYQSAAKQALTNGYGLILSEPLDAQEAGWMDMAVKASAADRDVYRATLSTTDLTKFDAMRERMVGDLERIAAYEAFTGFTFLSWSKVRTDAFQLPGSIRSSGRPVEVWVPLSQVIAEQRAAEQANEAGYIRITIPAPAAGAPHITTLWARLVDDATTNLMPTLRLAKYIDAVNLNITDQGIRFDFSAMDAAVAAVTSASKYEGAALVMDLERVYGASLEPLGWTGTDQVRGFLQQAATDVDLQHAFGDLGYALRGAGATTGSSGADAYMGDAGANTFSADQGDDFFDGGAGNDLLRGGFGNDRLFGGIGNDQLFGDDGNDAFDGGAGNDTLTGGLGNNTYLFGKGDGQDFVTYTYDGAAGKLNTLQLKSGVAPSEINLKRVYDSSIGSNAAVELSIAGTTDKITLGGFLYSDTPNTVYSSVQQIRFADGTTWTTADILARLFAGSAADDSLIGTTGAETITGGDGNDSIAGRAGNDTLLGGAGNDSLSGEDGNDSLDGGTGNDTMVGGAGNDIYVVDATADVVTENANEGIDTVQSSVAWTLSANLENLTLTGDAAINGTGNLNANTLIGNAAANTLSGGDGDDAYDGGAGNDTLTDTSTTSNDTYRWGLGMGTDTITDSGGALDHVDLLAGITKAQLSFAQNANNLEVGVTGEADKLIVKNWYASSANQIEEFRLSDGSKVLASEVQGLISAMAAFAAPEGMMTTGNVTPNMHSMQAWRYQELVASTI